MFIQTWLRQYCRGTFFNSAHCSFSNPISLRSVLCRRAMIPGKIFASFAKFQGIVSVDDFRLPFWLQDLLQAFVFPEKFLFCTDMTGSLGWLSPAPRLHIDDCFEIQNLHWELCDLLFPKHQNFCTRYGSAIASSARGPCNFGPLTDLAISVFEEMSVNTVLTQILTSLGCGI